MIRYRIMCSNDPARYARTLGVNVGEECRIGGNPERLFGSEPYLVSIGNRVTVCEGVRFLTHDGGVWLFRAECPEMDVFGRIVVGNNVFLGLNSLILLGVNIGDNCIIGAGSIVTKSIPANSIAAGCPARVITSTENYRQKCEARALYVHSMSEEKKREVVLKHLNGVDFKT